MTSTGPYTDPVTVPPTPARYINHAAKGGRDTAHLLFNNAFDNIDINFGLYPGDHALIGIGTNDAHPDVNPVPRSAAAVAADFKAIVDRIRAQRPNSKIVYWLPHVRSDLVSFNAALDGYFAAIQAAMAAYSNFYMVPRSAIDIPDAGFSGDATGVHPDDAWQVYQANAILAVMAAAGI